MSTTHPTPCPAIAAALAVQPVNKSCIARQIGRSRRTLYGWINGETPVPHVSRANLDTALGVSVDWQRHDQHHSRQHLSPIPPASPPHGGKAQSEAINPPIPQVEPQNTPPQPQTRPVSAPEAQPATTTPETRQTPPQPPKSAHMSDPWDWLYGDIGK